MNKLFSECSFSRGRAVICLVLSALLLVSLIPAPVLAQEGTSIPGSGTGTSQGNGTSGTTTQNNSSNSSGGCGGTIGCLVSSANNVKNGYVSLAESGYDGLNPFNSDGFGQELDNASSEFASAGENAKTAAKKIPGPWEILMGLFGKAVSGFINFVLNIVSGILWALFSLPAPGSAFDIGTWFTGGAPPLSGNNTSIVSNTSAVANSSANATTNVTAIQPMKEGGGVDRSIPPGGIDLNAWWNVVWSVYAGIGGLASLVLFVTGVFTLSSGSPTPRERNQRIRDLGIATALVLFGPIIMPGILHFGNILTAGLVPNATELVNSPGDLLKIGEAAGLVLFGSYIASGLMATGMLISTIVSFAQWIMTFMIAATWPIWAALYGSQNATLKAWSRVGFASFGILVGLKIFQGLLFRIAWLLPLSFSEPADSALTLLAFPIMLYVIFYRLPKYAVKKTIPAFVTSVGSGGSNSYTYVDSTERNLFYHNGDGTNNPGDGGDDGGESGGGGGGSPPPGGGATAVPRRTRTRDNDTDSNVDSGTNNPDDNGNVDSSSDTNSPDDSGNVDSSSGANNPKSGSETDTSSGTNNPSGGGSEDITTNSNRNSGQNTNSAETGGSTGRRGEEELRDAYKQYKNESGSEIQSEGSGEGSSPTDTKGSTGAPSDKELREALDQADAGGDDTVESGGRDTGDSSNREVPPDIQQHITRMEQEAPGGSGSEGSGGRTRTRDNGSDSSGVTEVVEEVKDRPDTNNSGLNEGSDASSNVGGDGGSSSSGSSSSGGSGGGGGGGGSGGGGGGGGS
jgi:hypothetical protein